MELTIPLTKVRADKKHIFQVRYLFEDNFKWLIRPTSKAPENQKYVLSLRFNLFWWTCLFKATEHPTYNLIGCEIHTSQREDMVKDNSIILDIKNK